MQRNSALKTGQNLFTDLTQSEQEISHVAQNFRGKFYKANTFIY